MEFYQDDIQSGREIMSSKVPPIYIKDSWKVLTIKDKVEYGILYIWPLRASLVMLSYASNLHIYDIESTYCIFDNESKLLLQGQFNSQSWMSCKHVGLPMP